jgi:hypothetical protein
LVLFVSIKKRKKVFVVVGLWVCGQRKALSKPCGKPEGFSIRAAYPQPGGTSRYREPAFALL